MRYHISIQAKPLKSFSELNGKTVRSVVQKGPNVTVIFTDGSYANFTVYDTHRNSPYIDLCELVLEYAPEIEACIGSGLLDDEKVKANMRLQEEHEKQRQEWEQRYEYERLRRKFEKKTPPNPSPQ